MHWYNANEAYGMWCLRSFYGSTRAPTTASFPSGYLCLGISLPRYRGDFVAISQGKAFQERYSGCAKDSSLLWYTKRKSPQGDTLECAQQWDPFRVNSLCIDELYRTVGSGSWGLFSAKIVHMQNYRKASLDASVWLSPTYRRDAAVETDGSAIAGNVVLPSTSVVSDSLLL